MFFVRTIQPADLDAFFALAQQAGCGMTSLKPNRAQLAQRIERVIKTLEDAAPLSEQGYLFVLEETHSKRIVGVCGIETAIGLTQPFYNYRLCTMVHASRELGVWRKMTVMSVSHDLTGCAELCSLFVEPTARMGGNGALLSKARFLFLAHFQARFPTRICAEMRGYFDDSGVSPFWRGLGAHFYQISFNKADELSMHKKTFVAELMPRTPLYVNLLPADAQAVIGKTHPDTLPARKLLETEGLRFENHVDIFDAGPVLEAYIDSTRAVRESALVEVAIDARAPLDGIRHLVSNTSLNDFRAVLVTRAPHHGVLQLTDHEARALNLMSGETARVLSLYPRAGDQK